MCCLHMMVGRKLPGKFLVGAVTAFLLVTGNDLRRVRSLLLA